MKGSILTIGTFDGVHLGHRKIFETVAALARKSNAVPAAITFNIPPRLYFFPSEEPSLLTLVDEKVSLLKACGIQKVHVLQFNSRLSKISAEEFFKKYILDKCRASQIIVGYNFGFGKNREGDARFLEKKGREYGLAVHVIPPVTLNNVPVSSGRIRDALKAGDLKFANRLLSYPYFLTGKVIRGQRLGARLGFPTANLQIALEKIVPLGVYAVRVSLPSGKVYRGMANSGVRPTVAAGKTPVFEIHLFGFSGNLYGATLQAHLIRKIREERAFNGLPALVRQLEKDKIKAQSIV